ncbi:MAG: hypothetical protein ABFE07_16910 [Armatimonadia bacterium]
MARKPWVKPQLREVCPSQRPDLLEALQHAETAPEKQPAAVNESFPSPQDQPAQG